MRATHKELAYALLRVTIGINMLGHGLFRILSGVTAFASGMADHLSKSPLPHSFVLGFGYCIPWIELALGIALILGLMTRAALACGALFIIALTFGVTSNQQWDAAGQQLLYSLVLSVLLFGSEWNRLSVDGWRRRTGEYPKL